MEFRRVEVREIEIGEHGKFRVTDDEHAPVWALVHEGVLFGGDSNAIVTTGPEAYFRTGHFGPYAEVWV